MDRKNPFEDAQKLITNRETIYSDTELSRITAMSQAIDKLNDYPNIMALTDLSELQIVLFEKARVLGDFWNIEEIGEILDGLAIKRLSKNRLSRGEVMAVLSAMNRKKSLKDKAKDFLSKNKGVENDE